VRALERVPLPAAIAIMSAVLVAGIYGSFRLGAPVLLLAALVATGSFGGLFLWDYHQRPRAAPGAPERGLDRAMREEVVGVEEGAEFADPVIEADRIASGEVLPDVVDADEPSGGDAVGP
jgi:hypothetical protein